MYMSVCVRAHSTAVADVIEVSAYAVTEDPVRATRGRLEGVCVRRLGILPYLTFAIDSRVTARITARLRGANIRANSHFPTALIHQI